MKAIIVDSSPLMLEHFTRTSADISDLQILKQFTNPVEALYFCQHRSVDIAILEVEMPLMGGITLAQKLREINKHILIVFLSNTAESLVKVQQSLLSMDYFIIKPYDPEVLKIMMENMRLLIARQHKSIYIHTFGSFNVLHNGKPVNISGKAKEILAVLVSRNGEEVKNETIFSIIWEDREYTNQNMKVYFNALKRLKDALKAEGIEDLIMSTTHGQMVNTAIFDCDYYKWKENKMLYRNSFEGVFMSEYSWGEPLLAEMMEMQLSADY